MSEYTKFTFPPLPMYETAEEMQAKINEYFERGVTIRKVTVKKGKSFDVVDIPVPTITGLVLYLGFADRHSFYDYEKKPLFTHTIKRARSFIESEYEEILATTGNAGAIFALKNFGWVDRTEQVISGDFEETRSKMKDFMDNAAEYNRNELGKDEPGNDQVSDDSGKADEQSTDDV